MKNKTLMSMTMIFCYLLLMFFFLTVVIRFMTRQILVEKLGWDNQFTHIVFIGDEDMNHRFEDDPNSRPVQINWAERYPFPTSDVEEVLPTRISQRRSIQRMVSDIEEKIKPYTSGHLLGHMKLTHIGRKYNKRIGFGSLPVKDSDGNTVIMMENGYLTYTQTAYDIDELRKLADSMSDFSSYLKSNDIEFVYVNAASKVCRKDKQLLPGIEEYTNENADHLIELLMERNVDVLDYRPLQEQQYKDWYSSYYVTDHHWKNTTALWAAGILAEYLNTHAGFGFDLSYFEESNYQIDKKDRYLFGGQGRCMTTAIVDPEPFSRVVPRFNTDITLRIPGKDLDVRGTYEQTMIDDNLFNEIAEYSPEDFENKKDAYHTSALSNCAWGNIHNHITPDNKGKRILILQDSFGWFLSSYLSMDISDTDLINLNSFTGSLRAYIRETQPDAVVLLICERNIRPFDSVSYATHTHFFDFR